MVSPAYGSVWVLHLDSHAGDMISTSTAFEPSSHGREVIGTRSPMPFVAPYEKSRELSRS